MLRMYLLIISVSMFDLNVSDAKENGYSRPEQRTPRTVLDPISGRVLLNKSPHFSVLNTNLLVA